MRTSVRRFATCAAAVVALAAPAVPALADDVVNDVDASVDATVEILPLEVGDTDTVTLRIRTQNEDGRTAATSPAAPPPRSPWRLPTPASRP